MGQTGGGGGGAGGRAAGARQSSQARSAATRTSRRLTPAARAQRLAEGNTIAALRIRRADNRSLLRRGGSVVNRARVSRDIRDTEAAINRRQSQPGLRTNGPSSNLGQTMFGG